MKELNKYFMLFFLLAPTLALSNNWFGSSWNSSINNIDEHPKTIAVRLEVIDEATGLPVPNAQATFKGEYKTEYVSSREVGGPIDSQLKEYELALKTQAKGIAVASFGWNKEYPWRRGIDDAEKVQFVEIRHPNYRYQRLPLPFASLFKSSSNQRSPSIFRDEWISEYSRPNLKCFVLDIGTGFPDFNNTASTHPAFFEKIKNKDWGTLYGEPKNWFSKGDYPQSLCGPYFMYLIRVELTPVVQKIQITN